MEIGLMELKLEQLKIEQTKLSRNLTKEIVFRELLDDSVIRIEPHLEHQVKEGRFVGNGR